MDDTRDLYEVGSAIPKMFLAVLYFIAFLSSLMTLMSVSGLLTTSVVNKGASRMVKREYDFGHVEEKNLKPMGVETAEVKKFYTEGELDTINYGEPYKGKTTKKYTIWFTPLNKPKEITTYGPFTGTNRGRFGMGYSYRRK